MASPQHAEQSLLAHIDQLQAQLIAVEQDDVPPSGSGDAADRVPNVEAQIRIAEIERRINELHLRLQDLRAAPAAPVSDADIVDIGSVVTISFEAGESEKYRIEPIDESDPDLPVITPSSPLGHALLGARRGQRVTYKAKGPEVTVELLEVSA
jgi:transcription elongation GreA/GreB family factor